MNHQLRQKRMLDGVEVVTSVDDGGVAIVIVVGLVAGTAGVEWR
jgi:hypothetical protein